MSNYKVGSVEIRMHELILPGKYKVGQLRPRYVDRPHQLPEDLQSFVDDYAAKKKANAGTGEDKWHDADLNHTQVRLDDITDGSSPILDFSSVRWLDHEAVNKNFDKPVMNGKTIREIYGTDLDHLDKSLPNVCGVNTTLISEPDNMVLLGKRSGGVGIYTNVFSTPIGGFMKLKDDWSDEHNAPNPFKTPTREEFGRTLGVKPKDVVLYGVGRHDATGHVNFFGEVKVPFTVAEILKVEPLSDDEFSEGKEFEKYLAVPWNLEAVASRLRKLEWSPAGAMSTVYSMFEDFGEDKVQKALA